MGASKECADHQAMLGERNWCYRPPCEKAGESGLRFWPGATAAADKDAAMTARQKQEVDVANKAGKWHLFASDKRHHHLIDLLFILNGKKLGSRCSLFRKAAHQSIGIQQAGQLLQFIKQRPKIAANRKLKRMKQMNHLVRLMVGRQTSHGQQQLSQNLFERNTMARKNSSPCAY